MIVALERWRFYARVDPEEFSGLQTYEIALTKRVEVIGTIAANASYLGLLGTVLGIMLTFHTMGTSGAMAVSSIMVGLSLALKATAVGLVVAIPCNDSSTSWMKSAASGFTKSVWKWSNYDVAHWRLVSSSLICSIREHASVDNPPRD